MEERIEIPIKVSLTEKDLHATFSESNNMSAVFGETTKVSTANYEELSNKPQINGVTLIGNKSSPELKLQGQMDTLSQTDIEKILYLG